MEPQEENSDHSPEIVDDIAPPPGYYDQPMTTKELIAAFIMAPFPIVCVIFFLWHLFIDVLLSDNHTMLWIFGVALLLFIIGMKISYSEAAKNTPPADE